MTLSATITPAGLAVSGYLQFAVGGVNVGGHVAVSGSGTYSVNYVITQAQGTYPVTAVFTSATAGILGSSGGNNLTVSRENARVTPWASNPQAVQVSSPGGTASLITLVAAIQELADGSLGDISKATPVSFTLIPVVAASSIKCLPVSTSVASGVLTATATCSNVPVNAYDVSIVVGGDYYTGTAILSWPYMIHRWVSSREAEPWCTTV